MLPPSSPRAYPAQLPTYQASIGSSTPFHPEPSIILETPPALDPLWLAHEEASNLKSKLVITDPKDAQIAYSEACKQLNAHLLSGRDSDLNHGIKIHDTFIDRGYGTRHDAFTDHSRNAARSHRIPIRTYNPSSSPDGPSLPLPQSEKGIVEDKDIVIYYYGGGLCVGDLDSEDLACRRICKELGCTVYSIAYRLMPDFSAEVAFKDAMHAFTEITRLRRARRLIVMGSSSGGQLAAMVSQAYGKIPYLRMRRNRIHGVLLRAPVTCDATEGGINIPSRFRGFHKSMSEAFHTSLLSKPALTALNRTESRLPLEAEDFEKLPRHWIQVCTNDIYYSDGVLYAEALRDARVEVEMDILEGYPHTFWLKAPELERAVEAEADMISGLKWLLDSEVENEESQVQRKGNDTTGFVPFSNEDFERKFMGLN